jgi:Pyrimidine dimer DNA glycosylase
VTHAVIGGDEVQTFLPCADFAATAGVLDQRRLGKQRVEAIQVLRALTVPGYGWRHHPAAAMWAGYEEALVSYGLAICACWTARGHADTCAATLRHDLGLAAVCKPGRAGRGRRPAALVRRPRPAPQPPVGSGAQGP